MDLPWAKMRAITRTTTALAFVRPWALTLPVLFAAGALEAQPKPAPIAQVDVTSLRRIGTVDPRFQSYNIEMLEVMGGSFWKPYAPGPGVSGRDSSASPFEYRKPIDLTNPRLRTLAKALGPAYLRVSGTWANTAYFSDTDNAVPTPHGFKGVLTRKQWRGVVDFGRAVDAKIVTSFAIGDGVRDASGVWTPDTAERWVRYTRSIGGTIAAAEFMNEPSMAGIGGAPAGYTAADYGRDFRIFAQFVRRTLPTMKILGPGSASETPAPWGMPHIPGSLSTPALLEAMGPGIDGFSYHHYGAASQRCAAAKMPQIAKAQALSEEWLARTSLTRDFYAGLRDRYTPGKPLWMTEGADAACGGNPWGGSFTDSFRYLDQLGRLAKAGVQVSIHNTLAASDYSLLNPDDLSPKANYWAALLWHRLMGPAVLDAGIPLRSGLHVYAHCLAGNRNGVSLLVINNGSSAEQVRVRQQSERYTLESPGSGSSSAMLNGHLLALETGDALPAMSPVRQHGGVVTLAPETITFLAFPGASNPMCKAPRRSGR